MEKWEISPNVEEKDHVGCSRSPKSRLISTGFCFKWVMDLLQVPCKNLFFWLLVTVDVALYFILFIFFLKKKQLVSFSWVDFLVIPIHTQTQKKGIYSLTSLTHIFFWQWDPNSVDSILFPGMLITKLIQCAKQRTNLRIKWGKKQTNSCLH